MHDLIVVGAGMAGLSAAAYAAERGADVLLLEKREVIGGSAALSAGIVWTAADEETLQRIVPGGDGELGRALVEGFDAAVERIRALAVAISDRWHGQMGFGIAHHVDIAALIERLRATIEGAGGTIARGVSAQALRTRARAVVCGVSTATGELDAHAVLLATGGFQGDPELVQRPIGFGADQLPVRSNPGSVGDGWRMGRAAGGAASRCLGGFYGHLLPDPLRAFTADDFLPLTQYYSSRALIVNALGRRFVDESRGDEVANQLVLRQPGSRAVILLDERIRREVAVAAPYPFGQVVDRIAEATRAGGRVAEAQTIGGLVSELDGWGVPRANLTRTLLDYAAAARGEAAELDAPLPGQPAPLVEPPFYAVAVQPSITFTFGGLRVDVDGRVLDRDDTPVPGLYAAGADAGGLQDLGYVGGLALGLVFGPSTAQAALARPVSLTTAHLPRSSP